MLHFITIFLVKKITPMSADRSVLESPKGFWGDQRSKLVANENSLKSKKGGILESLLTIIDHVFTCIYYILF